MNKLVRMAVALAVMAGGLLAGAAPAHATACNDADHDIWVGDPALVFVGVNNEPANPGLCVRVAGKGANVFIPIFAAEPQPGLHIVATDVKVCTVGTMAGPGERCANAGAGVTVDENRPGVYVDTLSCVDPNPNEPFLWTCVSSGTGVQQPWFTYVCVQAASQFNCVVAPPPLELP